MTTLTPRQHDMLALAQQWWHSPAEAEAKIAEAFGCSASQFYTEIWELTETEAALASFPMFIRRLRREVARAESRERHPSNDRR